MDPTVVASIITAIATVLAAVIPRLSTPIQTSGVSPLAFGAFITGVIAFVGLVGQMDRINEGITTIGQRLEPIEDGLGDVVPEIGQLVEAQTINIEEAIGSLEARNGPREPTLEDLTEVPQPSESEELARHAEAILTGSGRREWPLDDGTALGLGTSFFVSGSFWFSVAIPATAEDGTFLDRGTCLAENGGRLTVRGFSLERQAALVEYEAPSDFVFGTSCHSGTHFFFSLD